MTHEPLFEKVFHDITGHIPHPGHHHQYPENDTRKERNMDLVAYEQDLQAKVQAGMDKAADVYNHFKSIVEEDLPKLAAAQQSGVVQALEGIVLPPDIDAELTTIAKTYAARFGAAAPAAASATPAEAAPADAAPMDARA
jgi:hypothetical protein